MTTTTFKSIELFGGAMVVDLPSGFADVSDIRQVPDHQEVYLDKDGFTSIVFDLVERVDPVANDEEALKYHLEDMVESGEQSQIWSSNRVKLPNLLCSTPAYTLLATQHPAPDPQARRPVPDFTGILLTLIRLEEQKTDLLITLNVPHITGQYAPDEMNLELGMLGKQLSAALVYRNRILETFEIRDWGLFI
ncbi:MAG: hypothetical protein M1830_000837 [Pleopsidium flavum]|nr:MAG: hypothetical protein M1830_000837 [Pleopsidium flavum]